ncbi:MAG: hypothetical protein EOO88_43610 [Pedobacter sp.]|nr:MAG: hypothetical protein EOO88_43610 [Pedobacter sp.]
MKEVNVQAKKIDQRYSSQSGLRVPEGHADLTIDMSKEKNFASMESFIRQKLSRSGIRFGSYRPVALGPEVMNYPYAPYRLGVVPMRIVVDGRRMNPEEAVDIFNNSSLDQTDIVKIDVVITGAMANMFEGPVIMFYTRPDRFIRKAELNVINLSPRGYNKVKSFYSPKYDRGNNNHFADLRSTVYWNPNLRVYASGKATFNYFNADGPGKYKVIVEGINAAGELGRTVYRYEVEASGHEFQAPIDYNNSIVASLDSLQRRLPVEKVYLHTDKPYYNLGDTLWFKSYLLNATNFTGSTRSGLLYIELVDDSSEVVRRISVPVTKGLSWAQIPLTDKIFQEGGYTLRAYTNWMQNFGSDYIFTKRLYLGKPSINTWLVQSKSKVNRLNAQDELEVDIQLKRSDKAPVGLKDVEVRIYEANRYISKQTLQTSQDGELKFSSKLKEKADG